MRIDDHLSKNQLDSLRDQIRKRSGNELIKGEWKELMGMHMDTYTRRNGAIRRK
jgi:hypothetical protein